MNPINSIRDLSDSDKIKAIRNKTVRLNFLVTENEFQHVKWSAQSCDTTFVAVHNGTFHADDVVAAALMLLLSPNKTLVVRTRDSYKLDKADVCIDVGGGEYDHHGARKAECGTINGVTNCGCTLLATALGLGHWKPLMDHLTAVAASDNGEKRPAGYENCAFDFIRCMTPDWDDEEANWDLCFQRAVMMAARIIQELARATASFFKAEKLVSELPADKDIVQIPGGLPGWKEKLCTAQAKFVVFPSLSKTGWMVQAVPVAPGSLENKVPLAWAGLDGGELEEASGIPGAAFVHANAFLGEWKTKENAIIAAKQSIRLFEEAKQKTEEAEQAVQQEQPVQNEITE